MNRKLWTTIEYGFSIQVTNFDRIKLSTHTIQYLVKSNYSITFQDPFGLFIHYIATHVKTQWKRTHFWNNRLWVRRAMRYHTDTRRSPASWGHSVCLPSVMMPKPACISPAGKPYQETETGLQCIPKVPIVIFGRALFPWTFQVCSTAVFQLTKHKKQSGCVNYIAHNSTGVKSGQWQHKFYLLIVLRFLLFICVVWAESGVGQPFLWFSLLSVCKSLRTNFAKHGLWFIYHCFFS